VTPIINAVTESEEDDDSDDDVARVMFLG
jgi:hypothetical protein